MATFILMGLLLVQPVWSYSVQSHSKSTIVTSQSIPFTLNSGSIEPMHIAGSNQYGSMGQLLVDTVSTDSEDELIIVGSPLNYPNPFQLRHGTTIGYSLSADTAVKLDIYNAFGHRIYTQRFESGANGGSGSMYNRIDIGYSDFKYDLPAGAYFYTVLTDDNQLLGKGRMAIIP